MCPSFTCVAATTTTGATTAATTTDKIIAFFLQRALYTRAKVVGTLIFFFQTYHINIYSVFSFYIFALISLIDIGQKELK